MTAAQIAALPVQSKSRLIRSSDTNVYYAIEAGQTGAQAKLLDSPQPIIRTWAEGPPVSYAPAVPHQVGHTFTGDGNSVRFIMTDGGSSGSASITIVDGGSGQAQEVVVTTSGRNVTVSLQTNGGSAGTTPVQIRDAIRAHPTVSTFMDVEFPEFPYTGLGTITTDFAKTYQPLVGGKAEELGTTPADVGQMCFVGPDPNGRYAQYSAISVSPVKWGLVADASPMRPLSPLFVEQLSNHQNVALANQQLTLWTVGDSMASESRLPGALANLLNYKAPIIGYALEYILTTLVSGTVVQPPANANGNASPTLWDYGKVWKMSSGAVIKCGHRNGGTSGVYGDKVIFYFSKLAAGGTATIEYSKNNQSSWTSLGTVATAGTAGTMARGEFALSGASYYSFRITATGGAVNYIGCKIWNSQDSGIILCNSNMGGVTVARTLQAPAEIRNTIAADMGKVVLVSHFREGQGEMDYATLTQWLDAWKTAIPTGEIILIDQLEIPTEPASNTETATINAWFRREAANRAYVRVYPLNDILISEAYRELRGWNTDKLHLTDGAWAHVAGDFVSELTHGAQGTIPAIIFRAASGGRQARFGNTENDSLPFEWVWAMPGGGRGRWGVISRTPSGGIHRAGFVVKNSSPTETTLPDGAVFELGNEAGYKIPFSIDQYGYMAFGPGAVNRSAYTLGARQYLEEDSSSKAVSLKNHTHASPAALDTWQHQGVVKAQMLADGTLSVKALRTSAVYADDAAAAAAGVAVGDIYRKTGGTVVWRQA